MTRKTPRDTLIQECSFANNEQELISLATSVREIFPKGINKHTNTPNRQPVREVSDALLRMYDYYRIDCTREEIINAATKYVQDKQYDPYRQCVKYFIVKDLTKEGRGIVSALVTYIESARDGDENNSGDSWVTQLV